MDSLSSLPRLGPKTTAKLARLGIRTGRDLLYHFPHRYLDFSNKIKISQVQPDMSVTLTGKILQFQNIYTRFHKNMQKAVLQDHTGTIGLIWFNQPYLSKNILVGETYTFAGTVSSYQGKLTLVAPIHLSGTANTILPVYPETKGLKSGWFRTVIPAQIHHLLSTINDPLPQNILRKFSLTELKSSLSTIHCPEKISDVEAATSRLALDEILSLQSQSFINQEAWARLTPPQILVTTARTKAVISRFIKSLPFDLTPSQLDAWTEIKSDLLRPTPMNRLLQGEVGSGKTILAILSALLAHTNQTHSLILAPTEILARQHYTTFKKFLKKIPIYFLSGTAKTKIPGLKPGSIVISTHAAIYRKDVFKNNLGLLIIDEQHKFGVRQRSFLTDSLHPPHTLTMTATPIPRTVSLTIMGDLNLTTLKSIPSGRPPVKTFLVPTSKINDCYRWLSDHIKNTREQAFIVCPFIEISETMATVKSAQNLFKELQPFFPSLKLGLIHGKIKSEDREEILEKFKHNKINILISTPMIEVGIDFPNATTIIIQSADRFGLAQLHQLRGRVGRGSAQSYCYLLTESQNDKAVNRLQFLACHHDGQKIAEYDLKTRGPGEIYSFVQHGFPSLKLARLTDYDLINLGQKVITAILEDNPQFNFKKLIHQNSSGITVTN